MNEIATLCEQNVLGAILQNDEAQKQLDRLSPDDMGDDIRKELISVAIELRRKRKPIDLQSVCAGCADTSIAFVEAIECLKVTPSSVLAESYTDALLAQSMRRKLYRISEQLARDSLTNAAPEEIATEAIEKIRAIGTHKSGMVSLGQMAAEAYDDVEQLASGKVTYIKTGIPDIDLFLGGLYKGEVTIIAARPGVGKSALAATIAYNVAKRGGKVCIVSLEMTRLQYAKRLMASEAFVDGRKLRDGKNINAEEWDRLATACSEMQGYDMPFMFDAPTVEEVRAQAQHRMDTSGLDLLVIDYLQLLRTRREGEDDYARITAVSHAIKRMALDLNIPILALAQVSRPSVKGVVRMPTLDTLRGSGDIEQDADGVIFLHDPDGNSDDPSIPDYDRETARSLMEMGEKYIPVSVAKQRNGVCGGFGMHFDAKHMRYTCIDHEGR